MYTFYKRFFESVTIVIERFKEYYCCIAFAYYMKNVYAIRE